MTSDSVIRLTVEHVDHTALGDEVDPVLFSAEPCTLLEARTVVVHPEVVGWVGLDEGEGVPYCETVIERG